MYNMMITVNQTVIVYVKFAEREDLKGPHHPHI